MGKWFRDVWSEIIASGVLAAMTTVVGLLQRVNPVVVAAISFTVILVTFRLVYYFQEKRLKARLSIEKERWNRLREERIRLRKPYEDRLEISKLLTEMNDRAISFTKEQLKTNITKKKWEQMAKNIGEVIPKHTIFIMLILPKFQNFAKNKMATRFLLAFLVDVTGVLNKYGYGSLEAERDDRYALCCKQVREYEIGLPAKICENIESTILLSKMFSTLQIFDFSQPALRKIKMNPVYANKFQYLPPTIQIMSSKAIGNIHDAVEKWLIGD